MEPPDRAWLCVTGGPGAGLLPQPAVVAAPNCGVCGREGRLQRREAHEVSGAESSSRSLLSFSHLLARTCHQSHVCERAGGARGEDAERRSEVGQLKPFQAGREHRFSAVCGGPRGPGQSQQVSSGNPQNSIQVSRCLLSARFCRFCSEKSPGAIQILLPDETSSAVSPATS